MEIVFMVEDPVPRCDKIVAEKVRGAMESANSVRVTVQMFATPNTDSPLTSDCDVLKYLKRIGIDTADVEEGSRMYYTRYLRKPLRTSELRAYLVAQVNECMNVRDAGEMSVVVVSDNPAHDEMLKMVSEEMPNVKAERA